MLRPVAVRICSCCTLLGVGLSVLPASAFTLSDHAVKAFIRPAPLIAALEAEEAPGIDVDAVVADQRAANRQALRLATNSAPQRSQHELARGTYALWCIARSTGPGSRGSGECGSTTWTACIRMSHTSMSISTSPVAIPLR
jgi:hypothetical protein